jgi:hypothetical protein
MNDILAITCRTHSPIRKHPIHFYTVYLEYVTVTKYELSPFKTTYSNLN